MTKVQGRRDISRIVREDRQAVDDALAKGVREAVLRHKKEDMPVVIERAGKIELVKPEDVGY